MATIAGLAVAGAGIYGSMASAKSTKKGLEAQLAEMAAIREQNRQITEDTYGREKSILDNLPTIQSLLDEGGNISDRIRKDLLGFVLGDSEGDLREAQRTNAQIASFNFDGLNNNISKILRGSQFDIVAASGGEPIGSIANLSAKNIFDFAQQGLSNSLQLGDFFSRTGQTDRFNPYQMATDLYKVKEAQVNSRIGIEESRASRLTEANNNWAASFADISNAQIANQANKYQGISNAVSAGFATYSGMKTNSIAQQNANNSQNYYEGMIGYLNK